MRIVLWSCLVVGAALSLYFSYGIATQSVFVGSREGSWVYPYLRPFAWPIIAIWATALAVMVGLLRFSNGREWIWLVICFIAALVVEGLICSLAPYRFNRIFTSDGPNSFHSVAARYTPSTMLRDFEVVRKYWPPHGQSNMPGKSILVYWLRRISRSPSVIPWLVVIVSNLGALLLYSLARDLFDRQTAINAVLLYIVTPGKMFFFPLLNTVTPVVVLLAAWLFVRWLRSRNALYAAAFGASIYGIVLFEPAGLAIGGLLAGVLVGAVLRAEIRPSTLIWQGAVAVAAFAANYVAMRVYFGFDLWSTVRLLAEAAARFNVDARRPYDIWVWQNLFDFLIGLGLCQALLAVPALLDGLVSGGPLRQRLTTPAVIVTGSLVATLALTDLLGVNRGEVVRLWIFLACAGQLPAAYVCARLNSQLAIGTVLAVTLLHDALGTAMIGFIIPG